MESKTKPRFFFRLLEGNVSKCYQLTSTLFKRLNSIDFFFCDVSNTFFFFRFLEGSKLYHLFPGQKVYLFFCMSSWGSGCMGVFFMVLRVYITFLGPASQNVFNLQGFGFAS